MMTRLCEQSRMPRGRCPRWIPCHEAADFFGFFRPGRADALLWNPSLLALIIIVAYTAIAVEAQRIAANYDSESREISNR